MLAVIARSGFEEDGKWILSWSFYECLCEV